jgi:hypothetical protein
MYLSADGVLPLAYLRGFVAKRVRVAMNRDALGERLAQEAREELPQVKQMVPEGADWVEALQREHRCSVRRQMQGRSSYVQMER